MSYEFVGVENFLPHTLRWVQFNKTFNKTTFLESGIIHCRGRKFSAPHIIT
jgi:hypothetical protein